MSDSVDYWKDLQELQRETRQANLQKRQQELGPIRAAGFPVRISNDSYHWKIAELNVWPSTGRWWNSRTGQRGWLKEKPVLELIQEQLDAANEPRRETRAQNEKA